MRACFPFGSPPPATKNIRYHQSISLCPAPDSLCHSSLSIPHPTPYLSVFAPPRYHSPHKSPWLIAPLAHIQPSGPSIHPSSIHQSTDQSASAQSAAPSSIVPGRDCSTILDRASSPTTQTRFKSSPDHSQVPPPKTFLPRATDIGHFIPIHQPKRLTPERRTFTHLKVALP